MGSAPHPQRGLTCNERGLSLSFVNILVMIRGMEPRQHVSRWTPHEFLTLFGLWLHSFSFSHDLTCIFCISHTHVGRRFIAPLHATIWPWYDSWWNMAPVFGPRHSLIMKPRRKSVKKTKRATMAVHSIYSVSSMASSSHVYCLSRGLNTESPNANKMSFSPTFKK